MLSRLLKNGGISDRRIRTLFREGKIDGVYQQGKVWKILTHAKKLADGRFKKSSSILPLIDEKILKLKKSKTFNKWRTAKT